LNILELNELPPLAYQLFLLSRKGEKQGIIAGICRHFQNAEEITISSSGKSTNKQAIDFNRVEGTIIVHMCFAIKQDQELGTEFLKYIKKHKSRALNPFTLACMLSMARIHRFEDIVLELLKSTILSVYKDVEKLEQYPWLKEAESSGLCKVPIKDMMNVVITKASSGWDQVTQSLVQLGVLLIDASVSASPFKKSSTKSAANLSPTEETCRLAIEILQKTFKLHDIVRHEIMNHILSRIVTRASSVMHFLDLLDLLVKECPQILMEADNMSKIRETLDYLSFLPPNSAKRLLETLHPIIQRDNRLKEALMLILRKGIFAKATEGRQIAVHGLLLIINSNNKRQCSSSSPIATDATVLEILGLLRRCFSQQSEIRQLVYQNLSDIASQRSELASDILGMLQTQFQKYYVSDQATANPLLLDKCVDQSSTGGNVHIAEPIHSLILSLTNTMTILKSNHSVASSSLSSLTGQIRSLCFRLSKSEPEDYELDKSSNYDIISNVGMRNKCRAQLLMGCYEVCYQPAHGYTKLSY
jgi:Fanconi anemia group I protein